MLEDYRLTVRPARSPAPAGLVIVLDADDQFATVHEALDRAIAQGHAPDLHLVGVGYGGGYHSPLNRRLRDYTPTESPDEPGATGGAAAFLRYLTDRLVPALRQQLPVDETRLGITGHSLGSLFGLYALSQRRSPFSHYLISSPSIWWDDRAVLKALRAAPASMSKRRAHFSVGSNDSESMRSDLDLLREWLERHPAPWLSHTFESYPGLDHYHSYPRAAEAGLRWLFGTPASHGISDSA